MCGIAGITTTEHRGFDFAELAAMSELIIRRGPDDHGYLLWNGQAPIRRGRTRDSLGSGEGLRLGLAHRRLAIIDLTEAGWQPMTSADGSCDIVYNGEIYNHLELRRELEGMGLSFRSHSDTEVLLAGYVTWGAALLSRLVGMFAFAIWDRRRDHLFLARDFFGIKPLYYVTWPNGFAFASEIKALLALSNCSARAEPCSVFRYLTTGVTDDTPETFFAGIRQLPPAHYLIIDLANPSRAEPQRYWALSRQPRTAIRFAEAAERLQELFLQSVNLHMRSDVAVGAALSGGIDSSAIVCSMRRFYSGEIHTFTFVADDPSLNESAWAAQAAQAAHATQHPIHIAPEEILTDLDHLIRIQDQPFGSTSIYAQYRVFREASAVGIKVLLDGQGADEMLAGYRFFMVARAASLMRRGQLAAAFRLLRAYGGNPWLRLLAPWLPENLMEPLLGWRLSHTQSALRHDWFRERGVGPGALRRILPQRSLDEALAVAFTETSLPMLLRYEDRNSMAFSIESRVPFLTPELADYIFSLPEAYLIDPSGLTKAVFRQAMRGIVPDNILARRDKIGFQTPERHWLGTMLSWVERLLASEAAHSIPALDHQAMSRECRELLQGNRLFDWRLWRWINIIRWTELYGVDWT